MKPLKDIGRTMFTCQGYIDAPEVKFAREIQKPIDWFSNSERYHINSDEERLELVREVWEVAKWILTEGDSSPDDERKFEDFIKESEL